jgi:hypothetical protein
MIHLATLLLASAPVFAQEGERRAVSVQPGPVVAESSAPTTLHLYAIGHLTGQDRLDKLVSDLLSGGPQTSISAVRERLDSVDFLREQVRSTTASVTRAINDLLEPAFDAEVNQFNALQDGTLAVIATDEQHAWLEAFFERASSFDGVIDIQARIYVLDKGRLAALSQERSGEVVNSARAEELLKQLQGLGSEAIEAPRVVVFPFQQAELSVVHQVAYIQDYELKVFEDVEIADPVVGVAQSGVVLGVRCVPLANGELSIDSDLDYSSLSEPIPTFKTTLGGVMPHEVTLQLPEITRVRLQGRFELQSGETLVMASLDQPGDSEVLVRAKRVPAERK